MIWLYFSQQATADQRRFELRHLAQISRRPPDGHAGGTRLTIPLDEPRPVLSSSMSQQVIAMLVKAASRFAGVVIRQQPQGTQAQYDLARVQA